MKNTKTTKYYKLNFRSKSVDKLNGLSLTKQKNISKNLVRRLLILGEPKDIINISKISKKLFKEQPLTKKERTIFGDLITQNTQLVQKKGKNGRESFLKIKGVTFNKQFVANNTQLKSDNQKSLTINALQRLKILNPKQVRLIKNAMIRNDNIKTSTNNRRNNLPKRKSTKKINEVIQVFNNMGGLTRALIEYPEAVARLLEYCGLTEEEMYNYMTPQEQKAILGAKLIRNMGGF